MMHNTALALERSSFAFDLPTLWVEEEGRGSDMAVLAFEGQPTWLRTAPPLMDP